MKRWSLQCQGTLKHRTLAALSPTPKFPGHPANSLRMLPVLGMPPVQCTGRIPQRMPRTCLTNNGSTLPQPSTPLLLDYPNSPERFVAQSLPMARARVWGWVCVVASWQRDLMRTPWVAPLNSLKGHEVVVVVRDLGPHFRISRKALSSHAHMQLFPVRPFLDFSGSKN